MKAETRKNEFRKSIHISAERTWPRTLRFVVVVVDVDMESTRNRRDPNANDNVCVRVSLCSVVVVVVDDDEYEDGDVVVHCGHRVLHANQAPGILRIATFLLMKVRRVVKHFRSDYVHVGPGAITHQWQYSVLLLTVPMPFPFVDCVRRRDMNDKRRREYE